MFKKLQSKTVYQNKWMSVFEDDIEFENGSKGIYGYVKRNDGVGALVINPRKELLLIKQYRYPIQDFQWGIPGGAVDEGENIEDALRREIREETGLEVMSTEKLGTFYPLSSCSTENEVLFLAYVSYNELPVTVQNQVDESFQEKKFFSLADALEMIDKNLITDAYTCHAIQMFARKSL